MEPNPAAEEKQKNGGKNENGPVYYGYPETEDGSDYF